MEENKYTAIRPVANALTYVVTTMYIFERHIFREHRTKKERLAASNMMFPTVVDYMTSQYNKVMDPAGENLYQVLTDLREYCGGKYRDLMEGTVRYCGEAYVRLDRSKYEHSTFDAYSKSVHQEILSKENPESFMAKIYSCISSSVTEHDVPVPFPPGQTIIRVGGDSRRHE